MLSFFKLGNLKSPLMLYYWKNKNIWELIYLIYEYKYIIEEIEELETF